MLCALADQRWAVAICVVDFDLEVGQSMKECFPEDALSPEEVGRVLAEGRRASDVSFCAFPDSISGLPSHTSVQDRCACFTWSSLFWVLCRKTLSARSNYMGAPKSQRGLSCIKAVN
eukprot:1188122-Prorocentrum_minimum.AAC.3